MSVEELAATVARQGEAIKRIGTESREHAVHIADLQKRVLDGEYSRKGLAQTIERLTEVAEQLTATMREHYGEFRQLTDSFQQHRLQVARSESSVSRQAIWLWLSLAGGLCGWLAALGLAVASGVVSLGG